MTAALERIHGVAGAALVARIERDRAPVIRGHGRISDADRFALTEPQLDGPSVRTTKDGRSWTLHAAGTGRGSRVVVAVASAPLPEAGLHRLELAALRLARDTVVEREQRTGERLRHLFDTAGRAVASLDLDEILAGIVRDATRLLHADSGDMLLLDDANQRLRVVAVWDFPPDMLGFELAAGEGISWEVIRRRKPLQTADYRTYPHRAPALDQYDFGAVACVPLIFRDEPIGTINVHRGVAGTLFGADDLELLAAFADHAAIAIDHARRFRNEVDLRRSLADTNRDLSRSLAVQQRLAEQVILDGGPSGIALVLARDLGRRVVIEDHLHRVIAGASPDGSADWQDLTGRGTAAARPPKGRPEPFSVAVRIGREVAGHLVMSSEGELGPIDRALIEVAATGVALELAKVRAALEVEERIQGEAAVDLLTGSYPSEQAIAARAARAGYDLGEPRDVFVIDVAPRDGEVPSALANEPSLAADPQRRWLRAVRDRLAPRHPGSLAVLHAGRLVVLAAVPRTGPDDPDALADLFRSTIGPDEAAGAVTIAIGDRCARPADVAPAFRRATDALGLMLKLGRAGVTVRPRELGPYSLLLEANSTEALRAFATRELRPLVDHDIAHGGDLVRTLRVHLEEDRVQRRTAARCFIHVNTVVYRVRRIEALLGRSLDDPATVFDLTLALRIRDVVDPPADGARAADPA